MHCDASDENFDDYCNSCGCHTLEHHVGVDGFCKYCREEDDMEDDMEDEYDFYEED